jgi:predicted nucleic acid-binding protein
LIAYFDTSAVVPLLIDEPGTTRCRELWLAADRLVSVRLLAVEARAALAQAVRSLRIGPDDLRSSTRALVGLVDQMDLTDVDETLVELACDLAESQSLRAYDAVHLAAATQVNDPDLVLVAGDRALLAAAGAVGLAVAAVG